MKLPHGYTNETERRGGVVRKRYQGSWDPGQRCVSERRALEVLAGVLPVPRLISGDEQMRDLVTEFVAGAHGQDLIEEGHAEPVLASLGSLRRRMSSVPSHVVERAADGAGPVLVHGDFGPQNTIFDAETFEIVALVDWEWCRRGESIEDLAWAEWIVRMHHGTHVPAVGALYDAFGERPSWPDRHAVMVARCQELLATAETPEAAARWKERSATTEGFREI